jgi:hypothetical protein
MTFGKWIFTGNPQIASSILDIQIVGSNRIKIETNNPISANQLI